jgi:hypothetical protein
MVVRSWNGSDVLYGIFKRLKKFPFVVEEMALARERYNKDISLILYKKFNASDHHVKRRKLVLLQFGREGMWLSYAWRASDFGIDSDNNHYAKVIGVDEV